jgi:hypothetical protein
MTRLERDRPDSLSVPEMLRIMDVATTLRLDRELVEEQLNFEDLKARLKERMLAASKVTGESVTPEEVDAAIRQYYANLYTFREPKLSLPVALAHLWVRRMSILWGCLIAVALGGFLWVLTRPAQVGGGNAHIVNSLVKAIWDEEGNIRKLAIDPAATSRLARLHDEAAVYRSKQDAQGLRGVRKSLEEIEAALVREYAVRVVSGPKQKSAIDRYFKDKQGKRVSGYYLIVEAKGPDGKAIPLRIHSDETGADKEVTSWGERVPQAIYERLKKDKLEDGILNETAFAAKRKGMLDEEVTMPGPDGKPLARMGRITEW